MRGIDTLLSLPSAEIDSLLKARQLEYQFNIGVVTCVET